MSKKSTVSSSDALAVLKEGNARYVCGKIEGPNRVKKRRVQTFEDGQSPVATVVTCSDSRVPAEILFDVGIGDIFVIRVAGNICGYPEMGTIEYGVDHLGIPLLVILGHTNCGAVTAVVQREEVDGNLLKLAQDISPAVERSVSARPMLRGAERVDEASKENIWFQIEKLFQESPVVKKAVASDKLMVVGAFYDILHGDVNWLGKHPDQTSLLQAGA